MMYLAQLAILGVLVTVTSGSGGSGGNRWIQCDSSNYAQAGCFKTHGRDDKMVQLLSFRDGSGEQLDWYNMKQSVHSLLCQCNEATQTQGYEYFSIRYWAECWAGKELPDFSKYESGDCRNTDFKKCTHVDEECVGILGTETVYLSSKGNTPTSPPAGSTDHWKDYVVKSWGSWSSCSNQCGRGYKERRGKCPIGGIPMDIDMSCSNMNPRKRRSVKNIHLRQKRGIACNKNHQVLECIPCTGVNCGSHITSTPVINPTPSKMYTTPREEYTIIEETRPTYPPWKDHRVKDWGSWSSCSNQCGKGYQERRGTCPEAGIKVRDDLSCNKTMRYRKRRSLKTFNVRQKRSQVVIPCDENNQAVECQSCTGVNCGPRR